MGETRPQPAGDAARRFHFGHLRGDLFGGVTTMVVSLPMALAFGVASGAGALAGLWGAILVGLFAAVFGGTRTLISEPTGPMTVIMTAVVTTTVGHDDEHGLALAFTVVVIAGLFQVLFGLLKLGRYVTLMPYSVISGFMSGIGVLLVLLQIPPLLGHPAPPGGVPALLTALPKLLPAVEGWELGLGVFTLAGLFLMPRPWRKWAPPALTVLLVGTALSLALPGSEGLRRIGEIPMGLPDFYLPRIEPAIMTQLVLDGLILGLLGAIDTSLTAMIADSLTRGQHDTNRELIGQGIGNTVSGLFGGLPGAGATMGTVVNIQSGARTPWSSVVRAGLLLAVVLFAAPLTRHIPMAVLAAIAVHVGVNILDWSFLKRAHRVSRNSTLIMYGVMGLTVFVDLIVAVGIGVFIANIVTIERLSQVQSSRIKTIDSGGDEVAMNEDERAAFRRCGGRAVLFHLSGAMIFGVAKAIAREHAAMRHADVLILDLSDVPMLGTTVALSLENVIEDATASGRRVLVVTASSEVRDRLQRLDAIRSSGAIEFADSRLLALERAAAWLEAEAVTRIEGDAAAGTA